MKKIMSKQLIGVLALLCSSASMAATITMTSSNLNPTVGQLFTITVSAANFADIGGGTVTWSWNGGVAAIQHSLANVGCAACLPVAGPMSALGTIVQLRPTGWDALPVIALNGNFEVARFTFQALAAGALNFSITEVGTDGWFDNVFAEVVPTNYLQTNVVVTAAPVVPVPAAAWLLISALGSMVVLKRRPL